MRVSMPFKSSIGISRESGKQKRLKKDLIESILNNEREWINLIFVANSDLFL